MTLTTSERMELQRQARASNRRADSARHARLILLRADGLTGVRFAAHWTATTGPSIGGASAVPRIGWRGCSPATPGGRATQ